MYLLPICRLALPKINVNYHPASLMLDTPTLYYDVRRETGSTTISRNRWFLFVTVFISTSTHTTVPSVAGTSWYYNSLFHPITAKMDQA